MLTLLFSFVLLFGGSLASPAANQYFDNVIHTTLQNEVRSQGLEPARLMDFTTEFKDKVTFISVNVKVNYTNGNLSGVSRVRRPYECMGPSYAFGSKILNCTLSLYDLTTAFEGKMKYGKLPVVTIKAKANITETLVFAEVVGQPPMFAPSVKSFRVTSLGQVNQKFTGLGKTFNKYLKFLEDGHRNHIITQLQYTVEQRLAYAFGVAVSRTPLP